MYSASSASGIPEAAGQRPVAPRYLGGGAQHFYGRHAHSSSSPISPPPKARYTRKNDNQALLDWVWQKNKAGPLELTY